MSEQPDGATAIDRPGSLTPGSPSKSARPWLWPLLIVVGATFSGLSVAWIGFGSIPVALHYLRGDRLILEPASLHAEGLTISNFVVVTTEIHNYTRAPVRLLGSAANCTCVTAKDLPGVIPAGEIGRVAFGVRALPGKPEVNQRIVIYTDNPGRPQLGVHVLGRARE